MTKIRNALAGFLERLAAKLRASTGGGGGPVEPP